MARPRKQIPSYRLHKQSGQAVVTIYGTDGRRRDLLLGRYGSAESKAEYRRIVAELDTGPEAAAVNCGTGLTVDELVAVFWDHAERHYRDPAGRQTSELHLYSRAVTPLRQLYG